MGNNIAFLDAATLKLSELNLDALKALGELSLYDQTNPEEIVKRAVSSNMLIVNKVKLGAEILAQLDQLKMICVAATGYDNIDVKAANALNILVCNVCDYSSISVAQNVFAHILNIYNQTQNYSDEFHREVWSNQTSFSYWHKPIFNLDGKKIGLIGFGKIAQRVAKIALAFGMEVLVFNRSEINYESVKQVSLEKLLNQSDIVSLHLPLTESTSGLVNLDFLKAMKQQAILVNTARGAIINEMDLQFALKNNVIRAAGLDVLSAEPPPNNHPFLGLENCYVTPHQAWASFESRQMLLSGIVSNIKAYNNGSPINLV